MAVRIVQLGTERVAGEGLRIGTVRRPPRGVPKAAFASQNWYDVWFPNLAPSPGVVKLARDAKIPVFERVMDRHDIYTADECFLTGTAAEVIPVVDEMEKLGLVGD